MRRTSVLWIRAAGLALVALLVAGAPAHARSNASAAAGFIEDAQNKDGGFGVRKGEPSDPRATLWASVALLAAGKNPRDEFLKNGRSADDYLVDNRSKFTSLGDLGLLALIQTTGRFGPSLYDNPVQRLTGELTRGAVGSDPQGAALAVFGLLAADTASARRTAGSVAETLLDSLTSDNAWGPRGNADSASTALVLQALAATGAAGMGHPAVRSGLAYLQAAQSNDGSITASTRLDKATSGGDVAATAFTLQALRKLGAPMLKTSGGKTVTQGLTQYQQQSSGGLTSKGSIYSPVPPSVIETAQAYPAFNGKTFPLARVASKTGGPDNVKRTGAQGADPSSDRVSAGTADQGVSSTHSEATADPGAFQGATADGSGRRGSGEGSGRSAAQEALQGAGRGAVSGTVVGTGPRLAAKAGASDDGLTNEQRATILLCGGLTLLFALGATLERVRPSPSGAPPLVAAGQSATAAVAPLVRFGGAVSGISTSRAGLGRPPRRRWPLLAMLAVGGALIALPFAVGMFDRAPKGAEMIKAFEPYMQAAKIEDFERHVRDVDEYAQEARGRLPELLAPGAKSPETARRRFDRQHGQVALFTQQWPDVHRTFDDLLGTIRANRENYEAVAALPSFRAFPWFFVIPGGLIVLLAGAGLVLGRSAWIPLRRAAIALGVGLVLAPAVFQMFDRAPKGGRMVTAFETIETRPTVQKIQGDFATITIGQGAIGIDLIPALEARGLSEKEIGRELPATVRLRDRWIPILNDMTPMIGVMSDNVENYRAVAALPDFPLFIWFFVVPGLLVVGLAVLAGTRPLPATAPVRASEPVPT